MTARGTAAVALVLANNWKEHRDGEGRRSWDVPSSKPGRNYRTSDNGCTCADLKYRPWVICKHMLAVRLQLEIEREQENAF